MAVHVALVRAPIDPSEVLARVGDPGAGAVVLFLGVVRDRNEGRPVEGVGYEAYEEMAEEVLEEILTRAVRRFGIRHAAAVHRVGELAVGEVSLATAVAAAHRAEAYEASRSILEEVKRQLPVWKKERYTDGSARWLEGGVPGPARAGEEEG